MHAPAGDIKAELRQIADKLPETASYEDAMYELLLRMKLRIAREDVRAGRLVTQDEIEREFP